MIGTLSNDRKNITMNQIYVTDYNHISSQQFSASGGGFCPQTQPILSFQPNYNFV